MSLLPFCQWLAETSGSVALHESLYMYPLVESAHVLTLCLFLGMAIMFDLRLLGVTMTSVPMTEIRKKLGPWMAGGFVVMVITGALLFYAIPLRSYQNLFFRLKMILMLVAGLNVWLFHSRVYPKVIGADTAAAPPRAARRAGALSLVLWIGIIISGRMIDYNWFDCDRQPQAGIINFLTSCIPEGGQ